jgi:hypothetical protein
MNNLEKLFENVISENALTEYLRLYNELTAEIGIFYDKLFGWKAALRLTEANNNTISLESIYDEIDISINRIRNLFSEMREREKDLFFAANASEDQQLNNHVNFARAYMVRKAEASQKLIDSSSTLGRIKTDVINKIEKVDKRNIFMTTWNEYKTDINQFNVELKYIDDKVKEYAGIVDTKFHTNMLGIIDPQ